MLGRAKCQSRMALRGAALTHFYKLSHGRRNLQGVGQAGEPFAKVAKPVKNDAAIEVSAKADMIIINVGKTNDKGEPDAAAQPAVILLQKTNKGALNQSMDKRKFEAGNYIMSVVAEGKTASILFKIE